MSRARPPEVPTRVPERLRSRAREGRAGCWMVGTSEWGLDGLRRDLKGSSELVFQVRTPTLGEKGGPAPRALCWGPPPTPTAHSGTALASPPHPTSYRWTVFALLIGCFGDTSLQTRPSLLVLSFILFLAGKLWYLPTLEMGAVRQFLIFKRNSDCNAFAALHTYIIGNNCFLNVRLTLTPPYQKVLLI